MEVYAVVETGGKQYRVVQGNVLDVERLKGEAGTEIVLDKVLALSDGNTLQVGTPTVEGAAVTAKVVDQFRGEKIVNFKMKRRKGYRRKIGHRQEQTRLEIVTIG